MGLILTGSSSTAQKTCIPCCQTNLNRCCTPELTAANTEKLYVHFHNFQMTPVPWMTFHIADFTVELRRIDLDIAWAAGTPNFTWFTHESMFEPINVPHYNHSYLYTHAEGDLQPVGVSITQSIIADANIPTLRYAPILDKNGSYFISAAAKCMGSYYDVGFQLLRGVVANDPDVYHEMESQTPAGQRLLVRTTTGTSSYGRSITNYCGPLIASGDTQPINPGWNGTVWNPYTSAPGVAFYSYQTLQNGVWIDANQFVKYDPVFMMDWYLTE